MPSRIYKKTFTILELLIVIVIIGILATTLIPKLVDVQQRSRDAIRQIALRDISNALEAYALDNDGDYPKAEFVAKWEQQISPVVMFFEYRPFEIIMPLLQTVKVFAADTQSSTQALENILGNYIRTIPQDPKKWLQTSTDGSCIEWGKYFSYYTDTTGKMYAITAQMETKKWNTTNCKWTIDKNGDGEYLVVGKWLLDLIRPVTPVWRYNGVGDPSTWCKRNMTESEITELNELISRFSGTPQTIENRCAIQEFSLKWGTFGIQNPTNQNAWQKVEIPMWFNKLVWLKTLDLSAWVINIAHLTYPMFNLRSIHLDWNKHLKDLILPNSFPSLEEFVLQESLLSSVTFPKVAPSLKKITIRNTNLMNIDFPDDISWLVELRINDTKLQTIFLPEEMPNLQVLDLRKNKLQAPLPASTCALLRSKWWTSSEYIDNYNKLCK